MIAAALVEALSRSGAVRRGCRLNHAKGIGLGGNFIPAADAVDAFECPLLAGGTSVVTVRLSTSSPRADIADADPHASPRGLGIAIRQDDEGWDAVGHLIERFPARSSAESLHFLQRVEDAPASIGARGLHFLAAVEPPSSSFATDRYHMLHAMALSVRAGGVIVGRLMLAGVEASQPPTPVDDANVQTDFLRQDVINRLEGAPIIFSLMLNEAAAGDAIDDISAPWSGRGRSILLGEVRLDRLLPDVETEALAFDPGRLPAGIAFAGDPMIGDRIAALPDRLGAAPRRPMTGEPWSPRVLETRTSRSLMGV